MPILVINYYNYISIINHFELIFFKNLIHKVIKFINKTINIH